MKIDAFVLDLSCFCPKKGVSIMLCRNLKRFLRTLYWKFLINIWKHEKNVIFIEASIDYKSHKFKKSNWGDDLNYYFFNEYCEDKFIPIPYNYLFGKREQHYLLIGSIITFFNLNNTIIYGTGIQYPKDKITGIPDQIISVRGPKTRSVLLEKGIQCPEVYGDPALLLPMFYQPKVSHRKGITIIPNEGTLREHKDQVISEIIESHHNCRFLNMREYDRWQDVIDTICSSELIVSESLHGLIVAETYGIPSVWCEFIEHPQDWDFKFLDFYESIGKYDQKIQKIYDIDQYEQVISMKPQWEKGNIDYEGMLKVFPFQIKETCIITSKCLCNRLKFK